MRVAPPFPMNTPSSEGTRQWPAGPIGDRTRPEIRGKFLFVGDRKLYVRGVTYGAFRQNELGIEYGDVAQIERDFANMAENGINAVRIPHTTPPRKLIDIAELYGLHVMVGLSAESFAGYLAEGTSLRQIELGIREAVRGVTGHPALLCYALGNEIPASLVRWIGKDRVERYLRRLYRVVKEEDPGALVTYVNYPSTEYLDLSFLDLVSFNVYLEDPERFQAYLARLQNIAGDRPLLLTELGLDSLRNGETTQRDSLTSQIRTSFSMGVAGAFIFAWTDEWARANEDVEDWAFGLTRRDRSPKPALAAVREAYTEVPLPSDLRWPRVSVIVCTYNGASTIRKCLEGLAALEYPDYEVIVVNDGSNDRTADIVEAFADLHGFRVIRTENHGLSSARNTGLRPSNGEIIAYIDDDAFPDPHWLKYLAATFARTSFAGVGGPNIPPTDDGFIAKCVARSPGGPIHVLLTDEEAEHIPGCNMAFRREALEAVGGFDTRFRVAGDDVDICWRLQEAGFRLGFSPGAVVWHRRRNSVRDYLRQQRGYGKAEAFLEAKWPDRYNGAGHVAWSGRVYGNGRQRWARGSRIYHGVWGSAPFQVLYQTSPHPLGTLLVMPEWHLLVAVLAVISLLGIAWPPLLAALPAFILAVGTTIARAIVAAGRGWLPALPDRRDRLKARMLTAAMHVLQPGARLIGRIRHGLTPWRRRVARGSAIPRPRTWALWTERREEPEDRIRALDRLLRTRGGPVLHGGDFDRWDLEIRSGALCGVRVRMGIEEHGAGSQLIRVRSWPRCSSGALAVLFLLAAVATLAGLNGAFLPSMVLAGMSLFLAVHLARALGSASAAMIRSVESLEEVAVV